MKAGKQRGHLNCPYFRGDFCGQLITRRSCVGIRPVGSGLWDNVPADTRKSYIFIPCLIFSLRRKGESDRDEMDLADYSDRCLFDCWSRTLETRRLMSSESSCCGQASLIALHSGYRSACCSGPSGHVHIMTSFKEKRRGTDGLILNHSAHHVRRLQ